MPLHVEKLKTGKFSSKKKLLNYTSFENLKKLLKFSKTKKKNFI